MEFKRRRHYHEFLNIAPLVDVVFLLLLFFMLTSHLVQEPAIRVTLPDSKTAEVRNEPIRTVFVTKNGEVFFTDKRVDLKNLGSAGASFLAGIMSAIVFPLDMLNSYSKTRMLFNRTYSTKVLPVYFLPQGSERQIVHVNAFLLLLCHRKILFLWKQ